MVIADAVDSLKRFPQNAEISCDDRGNIYIYLYGYRQDGRVPMYNIYSKDSELPWLLDSNWLNNHKA